MPTVKEKPAPSPVETAVKVEQPVAQPKLASAPKPALVAYPGYDEVVRQTQDDLKAAFKSATILGQGLQEMGMFVFQSLRKGMEDNYAIAQRLFEARTIQDVAELNTAVTTARLSALAAEGTRLSECAVRLATEASAPLTERASKAMDRMMGPWK